MNKVLTLSSKNQLTLPVSLMALLGLSKGSKLWPRVENEAIILEKVEDSWDDLQGSLKDTYLTKNKTVLEVIELAKKRAAMRLMKKDAK